MSDTFVQGVVIAWFIFIAVMMYVTGKRISYRHRKADKKKFKLIEKEC